MEPTCFAKVLEYDLKKYYADPDYYLLNFLKGMLFKFKNFKDCTPLRKNVAIFLGVAFEKNILMGRQLNSADNDWAANTPVYTNRVDISSLSLPDFYTTGDMPFVHNFYGRLLELVDEDFGIQFPLWNRSSWGVAWHLRGPGNLLLDTIEDPEWVSSLLDYLTNARKHWEIERAKLLNSNLAIGNLYNDEVMASMISPELYENVIRPEEIELSNFLGGINYWHSCGNTTPFQKLIDEIPNVHMVHVSPWSDISNAVNSYNTENKALEIALYGYDELLCSPGKEHSKNKLRFIKEETKMHRSQVRAAGIDIMNTVQNDLTKVKEWIDCANEILL